MAGSNAPEFDPLNASPQEDDDMLAGYLAAIRGEPAPRLPSVAFEHGWRMASNDRASVADNDQRVNARRYRTALTQGCGRDEDGGGRDG